MKICISMDVEQDLHSGDYKSLEYGLPEFFKILDKRGIKSTLFVPAKLLEKFPEKFKQLEKRGHEIALHGLEHERFDDLAFSEKKRRIKEAVKIYKKVLKHPPSGFRAPQHSIDRSTLEILAENGFHYDSSHTPFNLLQLLFFPKRIKHGLVGFFKPRSAYKLKEGIHEFPISSSGISFVSLPLRIFPKIIIKFYLSTLKATHKNLVFYCHSWDLIPLKDSKIDRTFPHTRFIDHLDYLVNNLTKKDYFITLKDLTKELDKNEHT
nr:hypothetical protein [uncultured archaeon]